MRIAFYAPLKSPSHGTPSGDRRVAALLMQALAQGGHRVELASTFRSFDGQGDPARQAGLRAQGEALGRQMAQAWRDGPAAARPELWVTYHVYYKAPDWLGPVASAALGIPYVIAEPSHAPKRAHGPWAIGHAGTEAAIRGADLLLPPARYDIECLEALAPRERIVWLPPFLDSGLHVAARAQRATHRAALAAQHGLDPARPWLCTVAMMREGDKLASYRALAQALALLRETDWHLLVAGDGPARAAVEAAFADQPAGRVRFLGALSAVQLAAVYAASNLYVWPAVNEAYGMAPLEAQAAGLPVVSCATRGVPDVVCHGRTGILVPSGDAPAFAAAVRSLLEDPDLRARYGTAAAGFAAGERTVEAASTLLEGALARLGGARPHAA